MENKRELPFRNTKDPYKIWISEIMLQQTRMGTVLSTFENKFTKFIDKFPDLYSLASATLEEVFFLWSGLGYYNRAINVHRTAQILVSEYNGEFPKDFSTLLKLPGIGEYTASAILSIAYDLPYAVFDGNVNRVLFRFFYHSLKPYHVSKVKKLANVLIQKIDVQPSIFNQSLMELGALICTPNPKCHLCPLSTQCDIVAFPIEKKKNIPPKRINQKEQIILYVYIIQKNKKILIQKNKGKIFKQYYFFPYIEVDSETNRHTKFTSNDPNSYLGIVKHSIMNYKILAYVFLLKKLKNDFINQFLNKKEIQWIDYREIKRYLFTNFAKKILNLYSSYGENLFAK
ncbi:MAG: A/G-specific adenine glycosylase [Leptonema sp. (in: bacteria)]